MIKWERRYAREMRRVAVQPPAGLAEHVLEPHGLASPYDSTHSLDWRETEGQTEEERKANEEYHTNRRELDDTLEEFKSQMPQEHREQFCNEDEPNANWDKHQKRMNEVKEFVESDPELRKFTDEDTRTDTGYTKEYHSRRTGEEILDRWIEKTLPQSHCPACIARAAGDYTGRIQEGLANETWTPIEHRNYFHEAHDVVGPYFIDSDWNSHNGSRFNKLLEENTRIHGREKAWEITQSHPEVQRVEREQSIASSRTYAHAYKKSTEFLKTLMSMYNPKGTLCPLHTRLK